MEMAKQGELIRLGLQKMELLCYTQVLRADIRKAKRN